MNDKRMNLAQKAVDNAGWMALACIAFTSLFHMGIVNHGIRIDNRPEAFASADSDAPKILTDIRETFGRDDLFVVLIEADRQSPSYFDNLKKLEAGINAMSFDGPDTAPTPTVEAETEPETETAEDADDWGDEGDWEDSVGEDSAVGLNPIDQTISLMTVRRTVGQDGAITVEDLIPADDLRLAPEELEKRIRLTQFATENLVDKDNRFSALIVQTEPMEDAVNTAFYLALRDVVEGYNAADFRLQLGGLPSIVAQLDLDTQSNVGAITGISMLVMALVLFILFRFWSGIVGPLLVVAIGSVWAFGFMAWSGITLNYVSAIIPGFLVIVGLADSIHLQSSYAAKLSTGVPPKQALAYALAKTTVPVIFTSLTTIVGLLSFRAASVEAVRELGFSGSIGILGAMTATLTLLPFFLRLDRNGKMVSKKRASSGTDYLDHILHWMNRFSGSESKSKRNIVLAGTFCLFVGSAYGVTRAKLDHDPLKFFFDDHPLRVCVETLDQNVVGTGSMTVLIERPDGVKDLELLKSMEAFEADIRAYQNPEGGGPLVTGTASLVTIVKETNRALHDGDPAMYRIPDTQRGVSDSLFLFENASLDDSRRVLTTDGTKTIMTFSLHWIPVTLLEPFVDTVNLKIKEHFGERATVNPSGLAYSLTSTLGVLARDLYRSFGAAILMVTFLMIFVFRDIKLGLISMIPNVLPIMVAVLVMLLADIPLNLSNILIGSIAIGICVDDTIHFFHHFQNGYKASGDVEQGITHAFESTGRAMALTTVVLVLGLGGYLTGTLTSLVDFGVLVSTCVIFALVSDLIVAPALLRAAYGKVYQ